MSRTGASAVDSDPDRLAKVAFVAMRRTVAPDVAPEAWEELRDTTRDAYRASAAAVAAACKQASPDSPAKVAPEPKDGDRVFSGEVPYAVVVNDVDGKDSGISRLLGTHERIKMSARLAKEYVTSAPLTTGTSAETLNPTIEQIVTYLEKERGWAESASDDGHWWFRSHDGRLECCVHVSNLTGIAIAESRSIAEMRARVLSASVDK